MSKMENGKGIKLKFCSHQKHNYKGAELLVNVKDLGPSVKEGDILEIYHPDEDEHQSRLLLQIPHYEEEISFTKDTISVDQNIACSFQLRSYKDVIVNKVKPKSVALELLELTFRDQYLGRSDMWRLKMSLVNTVTYINKMIEFCSNSIRCQTYEMWAHGEKVSCGVITEDTKIVFRSSTCQAYLFIQMSSEMWEFDMYGDLYFEKAVNGFLAELFAKWKKEGSNHEVTIVLFSRTYYSASSIEEFPYYMRECLMEDYQGRFYEDFYRVAVQSERYDDWMPILSHLRQVFHSYLEDVLEYHSSPDYSIPTAYNSNAPQGNFLEVLNISLNVFERHFLDRSFERTGQMSVVVTPGVGVFEVDRELTNITKQRIIDNGVGSDLVCLGVQPLHAVPLLKFHRKRGSPTSSNEADEYSMPHTWINLSFYSSKKRVLGTSTFVPKIKVPQEILRVVDCLKGKHANPTFAPSNLKSGGEEHTIPNNVNSVYDYDTYDAKVFKLPVSRHNSLQRTSARKKTASHSSAQPPPRVSYQQKLSDMDIFRSSESVAPAITYRSDNVSNLLAKSPAINIPSKLALESRACSQSLPTHGPNAEGMGMIERKLSIHSELEDMSPSLASMIGSSVTASPNDIYQIAVGKTSTRPGKRRSLINPFNPSHVSIKLTSNQRRWIHTFPKDPTGVLIQQHHYQICSVNQSEGEDIADDFLGGEAEDARRSQATSDHKSSDSLNLDEALPVGISQSNTRGKNVPSYENWAVASTSVSSSLVSVRGISSPQKPSLYPQGVQPPPMPGVPQTPLCRGSTTGVDWKSLSLPACLPLTTDYFPDKQSLQYDYEVAANYSRLPDVMDKTFKELVSQRLSQGFQLIVQPDESQRSTQQQNSLVRARFSTTEEVIKEYKLSIGRVFHWLKLKDCSIDVAIYRPKHPYPPLGRQYKFRFRSPYLGRYQRSSAEFKTERLENYRWNDLDSYICFEGDHRECLLLEEFKYWRFRLMILPDLFKAETKKLFETFPTPETSCDVYHSITLEEKYSTVDNFIRFLEVLHRIKRSGNSKKSWGARERLGSVRMERPRMRQGTKTSDRVRFESGTKDKEDAPRCQNEVDEDCRDEGEARRLNQEMSYIAIIDAMKDPTCGVPMVTASCGPLPSSTFLSYDATLWVVRRFEDVSSHAAAIIFLQKLVDAELIRHVADEAKPFLNGFHLYYIPTEGESNPVDPLSYEVEWHEISIDPLPQKRNSLSNDFTVAQYDFPDAALAEAPHLDPVESSLALPQEPIGSVSQENTEARSRQKDSEEEMYRLGYLEVDWNNKSDRYEWGHLSYQTRFRPSECFELQIKWMCATGAVVNDLILTWQRKAANLNLHLFPVPMELFGLPFNFCSNPLRSPIVIPLNVEDLRDPSTSVFDVGPFSREQRTTRFQELILEKFGFLCYLTNIDGEDKKSYVHVTGNMIVLLSSVTGFRPSDRHRRVSANSARTVEEREVVEDQQPCFLWSFNYMLTRRWKSSTSGDEPLAEMILKDFRDFCSNRSNRLKEFWNMSMTLLPHLSQPAAPFVDVCMQ